MTSFYIYIDTSSDSFAKEAQAGGNIQSTMHIQADGQSFPSSSWLDFPVIVLAWWLDGYLKLVEIGNSTENDFMNGPYDFVCMPQGKDVNIIFRKRTLHEPIEVGSPVQISVIEYKQSLVQAAEILVIGLEQRLISTTDLDNLKTLLDKVRSK